MAKRGTASGKEPVTQGAGAGQRQHRTRKLLSLYGIGQPHCLASVAMHIIQWLTAAAPN